jgi:uncharacterized membrane protein YsdA (DUF1294 family)
MKRSILRVLAGVFLLLLVLTGFSLSVPPADFLLFISMLVIAVLGLALSVKESKKWRLAWTVALIISLLGGALEIIAGKRLVRQRSKNESTAISQTAELVTGRSEDARSPLGLAVYYEF